MTATAAAPHPVVLRVGNRPCVGAEVHYQTYSADSSEKYVRICRPAIVVELAADGSTVGLCVPSIRSVVWLSSGGSRHSEGARPPGSWHWPDSHP